MLRSNITHMTDMGPACSECGQQGLWGYAPLRTSVMRVRPAYRPQCGSCHHSEDILLVRGEDHDNIAAIRAAHQQRADGWREPGHPIPTEEA